MFDPWLSGFTFGIAILAAYVALALANRIAATQSRETRVPWFILGALATGLGIWAMHFVGMMAFRMLQVISYDINHLIGSAVAATITAAIVLVLGCRQHLGPALLAAGSVAVGAGLTAVHLIAMGGLHTEMLVSYRAVPLVLGIAVAVLAGLMLLAAPERLRGGGAELSAMRVATSVGAGVGLAGAHFVFLLATIMVRTTRPTLGRHVLLPSPGLGVVLVIATVLILSIALLGALADRYLLARSAELAAVEAGERALAATERRYQLVMGNVRDYAIFTTDLEGVIQTWNLGAERVLGYSAAEILGQSADILFTPEERLAGIPEKEIQTASAEGRAEDERPHLRADGSRFWASGILTALRDEHGTLVGYVKIIRDITERKRVEAEREAAVEKLTTMLESITDAFIAVDREWRITYFNHQAELLLGRSRAEVLGHNVWELYPAAVDSGFEQEYRLAIKADQPVSFEEYYPPLQKWLDVRAFPSRDGLAIYFRDTTARRAAEAELKQREEQLRQAQKMEAVGQLAGGIAHDFNNLLTAITGYAGLLLRQFDETDLRRADVVEIRRAAERAGALTQQLLAFSRRQITQPRLLNLNTLLEDLSRLLRRLLGEHIDIVLELSPDAGAIMADPGQIEQVIVNLAVNARDAMPEGGTLSIGTAAMTLDDTAARLSNSVPGDYVVLTVGDTGHGFDAALQERIFEPFFTTKEPGKGTGLGLSTVYGIVRQTGGTVSVTSAPGHGARFSILLPHATEPAETAAADPDEKAEPGTETVLLVEDEEAVRSMAARALREFGYKVLVAADGPDALELGAADQQHIDLLLTDVALPHLSGRVVAERLREQRPGMPVLFMSGYTTDPAVIAAAADRGRFIQKPFTPEGLLVRVRAILDETA